MSLSPSSIAASQTPLFDHGRHAKATRAAAASAAKEKAPNRREQILAYVKSCGPEGCIRHSIADHLPCPLSGVCAPVLDLLRDGVLIEDGRKRMSPYGSMAAVIVCKEAAER
ncbi:hypothetical protein Enr13x_12520 [Stieleria neptunia]|uniref:DprA winged helix domain-containing protein n=1 Tax=Stieleria neptunia TaxID=2527979 RepID=A0A518HKQ3_9BACT|nr:hypothetical protein [Stieleria neptunia]QDV41413.1 hypothetical protein Enr13x_12520 [Stieleria neptunia]